jgi:hypothetical protein
MMPCQERPGAHCKKLRNTGPAAVPNPGYVCARRAENRRCPGAPRKGAVRTYGRNFSRPSISAYSSGIFHSHWSSVTPSTMD